MGRVLPLRFYRAAADEVAPALLGAILQVRHAETWLAGRIVEVEAYLRLDAACHASRGMTKRNASMFGLPGTAYVYQIHRSYCLNMVCAPKGIGEAVLIRAIEPLQGLDTMQNRRQGAKGRNLTGGPGRLCQALGIDLDFDAEDLRGPRIRVMSGAAPSHIQATPRIGISQNTEALLRFIDTDSRYLSR
ncbi:MAG: DNA-3-methyladenine glycosylase [Deltaproteobacteria bacterium]|nr:DNA-3-methyladenine glycosylase [Deltaproteobacteria bacterium]